VTALYLIISQTMLAISPINPLTAVAMKKRSMGAMTLASQAKRAGAALVPPLGSGTKACRPHSLFSADR